MSKEQPTKRSVNRPNKHINITFVYSSLEELEAKLGKLKSFESTQFPDFDDVERTIISIDL